MTGGWTRRDFFRRTGAMGAVVLGGPVLLSACASTEDTTTFAGAKESGKIKIGFANEEPYGFMKDGKVTGLEPEVAKIALKNMGIDEVEGVVSDFDALINGLKAKKYAFIAAGMSIKKDRCENALFSQPEFVVKSTFLVPKGNPKKIKSFKDIAKAKAKVAVLQGAVEEQYCKDAGVSTDNIVVLGKQDDIVRQMKDKRVEVVAVLDITGKWLLQKFPDLDAEATESFAGDPDRIEAGGFTFRKGEEEFVNAFNAELKKIKESGKWLEIAEPFGFGEENIPGPDVTTEKLCQV